MAATATAAKEPAAPAAVATAASKKQPVIGRADFKLFEYCNSVWSITMPEGVTKEGLLDPQLWSMAPDGIQPHDVIRCLGLNWLAEILVRQCIKGRPLQLVLMRMIDLPEMKQDQTDRVPAGYTIEHTLAHGWTVTRDLDGIVMLRGNEHGSINSREDATRWLLDHATLRTGIRT